ncbi:hypothetical protein [Sulfodiicoccus acidiphilus]|uniref:hypothetical protein n=1 Tax=Sulfodiicoccus acidiphilus TaxID=1670455 RepID=UPI000F839FCF|nr:hypothetical protein [Sulfodiicoccus acidiphilus]
MTSNITISAIQTSTNTKPSSNELFNVHPVLAYEVVVDNEAGLFVRFSQSKPHTVETREAMVSIYRDEKRRIVALDVEYEEDEPS